MVKRVKIFLVIFLSVSVNLFAQTPTPEERAARRAARLNALPKDEVTRGPFLQAATSNSIVIRWRTATWARSRVRFGTTPNNLISFADDSSLVTEHEVKLTGLLPRTRYFYSIGTLKDTLEIGNNNYFVTLPSTGTEGLYRIGVFGDCGNGSQNQKDVRDAFIKYLGNNYMDSWILLGDNAYQHGTDLQYQTKFFDVYKDNLLKKYPLFPSPGNHEYNDIETSHEYTQKSRQVPYFQNFTMPIHGEAGGVPSNDKGYYAFDIGNIHFLSLDSYGMEEQSLRMYDTLSPQVKWVKKDLEANKNKGWVIAYWHHPPYTMGSHNSDRELELVKIRENFIKILERYGVDLILCGHSHAYERSRLMKGYYGPEAAFDSSKYNVSQSTALYNGSKNSCPYIKNDVNNQGTVYVVSGSAGQLSKTTETAFPHNAFYYSNNELAGAVMLEVNANRLDLKWITTDGSIKDRFTMMKNVNQKTTVKLKRGDSTSLTASFIGKYKWDNSKETTRSIVVTPPVGKTTYIVKDEYSCIEDRFEVIVSR
jgi:acid phosphatase type 7